MVYQAEKQGVEPTCIKIINTLNICICAKEGTEDVQ